MLWLDQSGEYTLSTYEEFPKKKGIKHLYTLAYTLYINGVVKRKNCTIFNMVRRMLKEKSLLKSFWDEKASYTTYLLNLCAMEILKNKTPHEALSTHKLNVCHLQVFGFIMYSKINFRG